MFTGIINHSGIIESFERLESGARLQLRTTDTTPHERGESVAVNGVCLTVLPQPGGALLTDVSNETLSRTTLGSLGNGARVNIERALSLGERLGGHLVQGHVDTVGTLIGVSHEGDFAVYRWSYPGEYADLIVSKGSIAVDGVSLTIVDPDASTFGAALIPETLRRTTHGTANIGDRVNLEFDMIAKYVRGLVAPYIGKPV
ncbi:MAG: riboflavin synthase [Acidobacteriota bacterium]|jgi:riboflavin synthase|nr:riboflavin synthase [Acidobacteriota bacterium]